MTDCSPYLYGNIKLGRGNFELRPIMIGTLFYQGQTLIDRKNEEIFTHQPNFNFIFRHLLPIFFLRDGILSGPEKPAMLLLLDRVHIKAANFQLQP